MNNEERQERLETLLGTLIGSLWAAGLLDKHAEYDLMRILDSDSLPPSKPVQRETKVEKFVRWRIG